ncbi:MAG: hypothetical protein JSW27_25125 [Phycisphaerales bacterium]|nr:MAG: hypothetical protein JSW27_25125 [Phycisphaerales bacterium]
MRTWLCAVAVVLLIPGGGWAGAEEFSWQQTYAKISPQGDIEWAPQPFRFEKGDSVRYIDYEAGNDSNDGLTPQTPWRHHPWDSQASGNVRQCKGIHTYVFKRGVYYRGTMHARESGDEGDPIRLTSDPAWGEGEAVISGGHRITSGWRKGVGNQDIPQPGNVWTIDLDFAPRTVYLVQPSGTSASRDDKITRIPLARMPNWNVSDPEDVKSEWWCWDNPGHPYFHLTMESEDGRKTLAMGKDTKHITGPKELYVGAIIWAEFGWVDGTPYPSYVQGFDAVQHALGFEGYLGSPKSRIISRNHRYYLEDKPQYLDDPQGEFWFEKKGTGGTLHIILPNGQNPNTAIVEAGKEATLIDLTGQNHIVVSGLTFRFANVSWNLTEIPWQYSRQFRLKPHLYPASIRVWGPANDITVANCRFEHINSGVLMKAVNPGDRIDHIVVRDCEFRETDHHGVSIEEGLLWGDTLPDRAGHLFDVKILRNYLYRTGLRSPRVGATNAINVDNAETLEIAGNVVERAWHAGINVRGAKISSNVRDCPLTRILIYQNKVTDSIRTGDDCGNIETWQGGSAYVFNNVSGNPGGFRYDHWISDKRSKTPGGARFGMAYYLDGAFKNYYFNNIGWGLSNDIMSPHGATTMFQEIISYQNMFFNNTAYNFVKGTRRQAPQAGRNKFMGNIWDRISDWVFWHTKPARTAADGNERDAGKVETNYALETNAFTGNVFHDITAKYGSFKSSGKWHRTFDECKEALAAVESMASDLGVVADRPVLKDPAHGDFSLTQDSPAIDQGVTCFVPWPLYATVGEWNFYPAGNDPTRIIDEHWYMTPYYYVRDTYYQQPMFPLRGVNVTEDNYVDGPLEDWTEGACTFNGRDQYAVCPNHALNQTLTIPIRYRWDKNGQQEDRKVTGRDFKSPQVWDSNFCIEVYFRTESKDGVVVEKMSESGYGLTVDGAGRLVFTVKASGASSELASSRRINDGKWHHIIAEADRAARKLTIYLDGRRDTSGTGIGAASIANDSDLFVCGTPHGRCLKGTVDFLRISLGTLHDAKTSIEELYAWQFGGPFLRDFTGRRPRGKRDAGALERMRF